MQQLKVSYDEEIKKVPLSRLYFLNRPAQFASLCMDENVKCDNLIFIKQL